MTDQELYQAALEVRADPRVQRIYNRLSPEARAMFQEVLGEQNAEINKATPFLQRKLTLGNPLQPAEKRFAPTETNILGDIVDRPRALVQAGYENVGRFLTGNNNMITAEQALSRPREVPDLGAEQERVFSEWVGRKQIPLGVAVPLDIVRQPIGWASTILTNPSNAIPVGALERFGARAIGAIPGAKPVASAVANWAAKNMPTLGKVFPVEQAARAVEEAKPFGKVKAITPAETAPAEIPITYKSQALLPYKPYTSEDVIRLPAPENISVKEEQFPFIPKEEAVAAPAPAPAPLQDKIAAHPVYQKAIAKGMQEGRARKLARDVIKREAQAAKQGIKSFKELEAPVAVPPEPVVPQISGLSPEQEAKRIRAEEAIAKIKEANRVKKAKKVGALQEGIAAKPVVPQNVLQQSASKFTPEELKKMADAELRIQAIKEQNKNVKAGSFFGAEPVKVKYSKVPPKAPAQVKADMQRVAEQRAAMPAKEKVRQANKPAPVKMVEVAEPAAPVSVQRKPVKWAKAEHLPDLEIPAVRKINSAGELEYIPSKKISGKIAQAVEGGKKLGAAKAKKKAAADPVQQAIQEKMGLIPKGKVAESPASAGLQKDIDKFNELAPPIFGASKAEVDAHAKAYMRLKVKARKEGVDLHSQDGFVRAVPLKKKGLGNKGSADITPSGKDVEDLAKATAEGAKKEVLGRLNLSRFPQEQRAHIKDLFKGKEEKLKSPVFTAEERKARAAEMEHKPVSQLIGRSPAGQQATEIEKLGTELTTRMAAVMNDKTVGSIDKVKKINQLGLEHLQKIATEWGRTGQALQVKTEVDKEQLAILSKLVSQLRADPTLSKKATQLAIKDLIKPFPELEKSVSGPAIFKYIFRNSIMSGVLTPLSNITSNTGKAVAMPFTKALDVTAKKLVSMMTGTPTNATYKEVRAVVEGLWKALRGEKLGADLFAQSKSDKFGSSPFEIKEQLADSPKKAKMWRIAGKLVGWPEVLMREPDIYAKNMAGIAEKYAALARGEDLGKFSTKEGIKDTQLKMTFQDEASRIGKFLMKVRGGFGDKQDVFSKIGDMALYAVQPFIQTMDRIIGGGLKLSLAGWANPFLQYAKGSYKGAFAKGLEHDPAASARLAEDIAYIMAGLPVILGSAYSYSKEDLVGELSSDQDEKQAQLDSGMLPYSFRWKGRYYPMRLLPEPLASGMQFNVAIFDAIKEGKESGERLAVQLTNGALKFGNVVIGKPYMGGLNSVISTFTGTRAADKDISELPLPRKLATATTPSIVKDVGVVKDTLIGRARKMSDNAFQDIQRRSGFTGGMVDELNSFGEPVTHPMRGADLAARDAKYALLKEVPVPVLNRKMMGFELTQQEYHDLKQSLGQMYNELYTELSQDQDFMSLDTGVKKYFIDKATEKLREAISTPQKIDLMMRAPMYTNETLRKIFQLKRPEQEKEGIFPF